MSLYLQGWVNRCKGTKHDICWVNTISQIKKCRIHVVFCLPKLQPNFIVILVDAKIAIFFIAYRIAKNLVSCFVPLQRLNLNSVDRFNVSLKQFKKTLGELRNKFVIGLLPAFKENIDSLNKWFLKNKVLINSKVEKFVETLGTVFKTLASATGVIFSALNPLVNLIGGWGVVLSGVIGVGILSWLVRLGMFLSTGAIAVKLFAGTIRVLTVALLTNPIALTIMAIVAALVLIADEIIVTVKGGDSLVNRFTGLKKVADSFIETLKETWRWLVKVKDNMVDFTIGGIDKVKDFFKGNNNQTPQKPHEMLRNAIAPNSKEHGRLNITYATKDRYKLTPPTSTNYHNSRTANNNLQTVNSNNKNTFNVSINVPKGTNEEQSKVIS